ncbi:phosphonate ABC transporter, permease protein PhnE [Paenibacillus kobensis]|uniref:phosphonate ABC transporter, permease protein PhnE n=1 Tax=Paenibacillus kobensis TaxID=59841 RepID=UPI000FD72382|nr:phosphonate ABC transporter, permease protein PhnE [Paenibacillus kobensis]
MYDKIFPPKRIVLPSGKTVLQRRTRVPLIVLLLAAAVAWSVQLTEFNLHMLVTRIGEFFKFIGDMTPPRWDYLPHLWRALAATLQMSLLGSMLGSLLALPMAVAASTNIIRNRALVSLAKIVLSLLRTLPTLVTALIATFVFGLGPMAGVVAIMLFTVSYVGKLLYEQIENIDMGPFEAMESIGMTRLEAFRYAVIPQVLPSYLSTSLFCFEGNVRYASILGYVGAGGVGLLINENIGWRDYGGVGMIITALIVTVYVIETVSEHFRKKLI